MEELALDELAHVSRGPLSQLVDELDHAEITGVVRVHDLRRTALFHAHEPDVGEPVHGLTDDQARDAEPLRELALGRQRGAGRERALEDRDRELIEDGVGRVPRLRSGGRRRGRGPGHGTDTTTGCAGRASRHAHEGSSLPS